MERWCATPVYSNLVITGISFSVVLTKPDHKLRPSGFMFGC